MARLLRAKIVVVSDSVAQGRREDRSGPALRELLQARGWVVAAYEVLPDESDQIRQRLETWTDLDDCDAVFTTGGTGLGPRDITPEATRALLEKEIPGLAELMRAEGLTKTRMAALSRGVAGGRKGKLIINLPGSIRGACESLESIVEVLPHAGSTSSRVAPRMRNNLLRACAWRPRCPFDWIFCLTPHLLCYHSTSSKEEASACFTNTDRSLSFL